MTQENEKTQMTTNEKSGITTQIKDKLKGKGTVGASFYARSTTHSAHPPCKTQARWFHW